MKGIILAGGLGTRLHPLTKIASKQLLPIFDKPLIYYPLSTLILSGIRDILIISSSSHIEKFRNLLDGGEKFGIKIEYKLQNEPKGIADSLILGEEFLNGEKCALILGDNIFNGPGLGRKLAQFKEVEGAHIFGYHVKNPEAYGVAKLHDKQKVIELIEKPTNKNSKTAIPGLYFLDEYATSFAKEIEYSARGELEILDVLRKYLHNDSLTLEMLPRGTAWFDSGTFEDMHDASSYVRLMQERTGEIVGDPIEASRIQGWIQ
jgi:glucose-1-phosphate thymidylyltransferase